MIVNNKIFNREKAFKFGFIKEKNSYFYSTKFKNSEFILSVKIYKQNIIKTVLKEIGTNEIYTLHLSNTQGDFVGKIREEYNNILKNIIDNCFDTHIFKYEQTYKIINYIHKKYSDEIEYLWEKFPDNGIARRKDNKKWYLAILTVNKNKLGINSDESVEVIDLRADAQEIPKLLTRSNIFPAYHMNKKHWITIILDNTMPDAEIYEYIDKSYILAKKK